MHQRVWVNPSVYKGLNARADIIGVRCLMIGSNLYLHPYYVFDDAVTRWTLVIHRGDEQSLIACATGTKIP